MQRSSNRNRSPLQDQCGSAHPPALAPVMLPKMIAEETFDTTSDGGFVQHQFCCEGGGLSLIFRHDQCSRTCHCKPHFDTCRWTVLGLRRGKALPLFAMRCTLAGQVLKLFPLKRVLPFRRDGSHLQKFQTVRMGILQKSCKFLRQSFRKSRKRLSVSVGNGQCFVFHRHSSACLVRHASPSIAAVASRKLGQGGHCER